MKLDDPEEKSEEDLEQGENTELNINSAMLENDGEYGVGDPTDQGDTCIPKITDFIFYRNNIATKIKKFFIKGELNDIEYKDKLFKMMHYLQLFRLKILVQTV